MIKRKVLNRLAVNIVGDRQWMEETLKTLHKLKWKMILQTRRKWPRSRVTRLSVRSITIIL